MPPTAHLLRNLAVSGERVLVCVVGGGCSWGGGGIHMLREASCPACPLTVAAWNSIESKEAMEMDVASQYPLYIPAGESRNHVEKPAGSASGKQEWKLGV